MAFSVVRTRKNINSTPELSVISSKWIVGDKVYWPNSDLSKLCKEATSVPNLTWKQYEFKLIATADTYQNADIILTQKLNETDSDDVLRMTRGTRNTPAMKKKFFTSSQYALHQPTVPSNV